MEEKGCGWEDAGRRGAGEAMGPGSALALRAPLPVFAAAPGASWQLLNWFPPRLILGGVEQPKRRRRALDRG